MANSLLGNVEETHLHTFKPSPYHLGGAGRVAETKETMLKRNAKMNIMKEVDEIA